MSKNAFLSVSVLDLSHNTIDEKGCLSLAAALETHPNGVSELVLNSVGMTTRGAAAIAAALRANTNTVALLQRLSVAHNPIGMVS